MTEGNGWKKLPNPHGQPEKWGHYSEGKFEWNLRIKSESSFREKLDPGSNIPRFDSRLDTGGKSYINPFTGEIGSGEVGTHLPLQNEWYFYGG